MPRIRKLIPGVDPDLLIDAEPLGARQSALAVEAAHLDHLALEATSAGPDGAARERADGEVSVSSVGRGGVDRGRESERDRDQVWSRLGARQMSDAIVTQGLTKYYGKRAVVNSLKLRVPPGSPGR